jgi:CRP-like cAMP-binding protein
MEVTMESLAMDIDADAARKLARSLEAIARSRTYPAGGTLFRQGEPAEGVLVVRSGQVRLSVSSPDGNHLPYRTVGKGYVLGLPALFSGETYSLTAEAVEPCALGFVDRASALELVLQHPDLCFQAADLLAHELRALREWQARNPRISA